ncbi:hypothetical protein BDP27DRAFT_689634 [Rhodocollybia butyracea]|uniref:Man(5)GlcNAc(2)-PP-dolichol translocation protein RFT1 n=1 Tax=Rhodocollybia butyracea TaxID=206335 RepID=A0A9P5TVU2_9AGAR|nr:hypothetical protein BDP27DRAFT_689634 [Rhodocollybia butyracea]
MTMTSQYQSLVKHLLTEGDKFILSWFSPCYALAVNYGSLVARIVFQPIKETLRLYFFPKPSSTLLPLPLPNPQATYINTSRRSKKLQAHSLPCSKCTPLDPSSSSSLPPQYLESSAPHVLEAWIWYIPVLAVNGGLEAFIASVAPTKDLNTQS